MIADNLRFDVCVIAAKPDENTVGAGIFHRCFGEPKQFQGGLLYEVQVARDRRAEIRTIHLSTGGKAGNVNASAIVSDALYRFFPSFLFFVGTAGCLNPRALRLGDVLLPRGVSVRFYNRIVEEGEPLYSAMMEENAHLMERFRENTILISEPDRVDLPTESFATISSQTSCPLNFYKIDEFLAARTKDVPIPAVFKEILDRPVQLLQDLDVFTCDLLINSTTYRDFVKGEMGAKAAAVDMESFGMLTTAKKAAKITSTVPIIVRGISDYAGRRSETHKDPRWGRLANENAFLVTAAMIAHQLKIDVSDWAQRGVFA